MSPPSQSRWLYLQHGTNSPHTLAAFVQVSPVSFTWIIQTASCFPPLCPQQPELSYKNIHHITSLFYSKFSKGFPFLSKEEPASPEQPTRSCSHHAQNSLGLVFDSSPFTLPYLSLSTCASRSVLNPLQGLCTAGFPFWKCSSPRYPHDWSPTSLQFLLEFCFLKRTSPDLPLICTTLPSL